MNCQCGGRRGYYHNYGDCGFEYCCCEAGSTLKEKDKQMREREYFEKQNASTFIRESVVAFAVAMEVQLRRNDHKGGWGEDKPEWLFGRLLEEVAEANKALICEEANLAPELADIGNFCMMVMEQSASQSLTQQEFARKIVGRLEAPNGTE